VVHKAPKSQVRLYCILARDANLAVVCRRGPSKQVLLALWHTDTDQFDEGQWLKARIYERRGGVLKELSEANLVIDLRDRSFKGVAPPSPYSL
jgi:hypothetical protein